MAKGIYCLKIYLVRQQFKLTRREENSLRKICCFVVSCYIKVWFSATEAIEAPLNDIYFLKTLIAYKMHDIEIADVALKKFLNHLWYLSGECVALSIFDPRLTNS